MVVQCGDSRSLAAFLIHSRTSDQEETAWLGVQVFVGKCSGFLKNSPGNEATQGQLPKKFFPLALLKARVSDWQHILSNSMRFFRYPLTDRHIQCYFDVCGSCVTQALTQGLSSPKQNSSQNLFSPGLLLHLTSYHMFLTSQ